MEELIKKGNYQMTKYTVPPEELSKWGKVAGEPLWKEWVKRMEGKGRPDAQTGSGRSTRAAEAVIP